MARAIPSRRLIRVPRGAVIFIAAGLGWLALVGAFYSLLLVIAGVLP